MYHAKAWCAGCGPPPHLCVKIALVLAAPSLLSLCGQDDQLFQPSKPTQGFLKTGKGLLQVSKNHRSVCNEQATFDMCKQSTRYTHSCTEMFGQSKHQDKLCWIRLFLKMQDWVGRDALQCALRAGAADVADALVQVRS